MSDNSSIFTFKGCNFMRQRLLLSLVSGKILRITDIRTREDEPGLKGTTFIVARLLKFNN